MGSALGLARGAEGVSGESSGARVFGNQTTNGCQRLLAPDSARSPRASGWVCLELVWGLSNLSLRISMALRDRCRNSNGGLSLKVFFLLFFYCVRVLQSQCFPMYTTYYMSLKNAAMNINRYPWGRGELYDRSCLFSKNEIMH